MTKYSFLIKPYCEISRQEFVTTLGSKIKILIVDDSLVIQKLLFAVLSKEKDFEIVAVCSDPFEASHYINNGLIDCMILDLELPKMDGLTFLKKVMDNCPLPTIIFSSSLVTRPDLKDLLIENGALAVFAKPDKLDKVLFQDIIQIIRSEFTNITPLMTENNNSHLENIVFMASSTGGTEVVKKIVSSLPYKNPPTVIIVQHFSSTQFSKIFCKLLSENTRNQIPVSEVSHNQQVLSGQIYLAPGNSHIKINKQNNNYFFEVNQDTPVHNVRPAADVTLLNYPKELAPRTSIMILSGMGKDGALGAVHLKRLGAKVYAQDEKSCVVFGMPKVAIDSGCVDKVMTIEELCALVEAPVTKNKTAA